jgi:hypothetical protein
MSDLVNKIANAVLYEGYMLYPYRPTAVKNRQRWNFGVLYPPVFSAANPATEASSMQTECLVLYNEMTALNVRIRFLHLLDRQIEEVSKAGSGSFDPVDTLEVDGQLFQSWQEAVEREVSAPAARIVDLINRPSTSEFSFETSRTIEPLRDKEGDLVGQVVRASQGLDGLIRVSATSESAELAKVTVTIENLTSEEVASRDQALLKATISTHTILSLSKGEFVSQLDPPEQFRAASVACRNLGTWPVLVGVEGDKDTMLSSPIILYDYPQIAPESAGNLFDGTEIDEILTLRIMTLTDEEKREMRGADERARQILERTETLPVEQFMKMHGAVRGLKAK